MELPGSHRTPVAGARALGTPSPDEQVEVTLLLRRRSTPERFAADLEAARVVGGPRRFLSREAFAAAHGAAVRDLEQVGAFARDAHLTVLAEHPGRRTVHLGGSLRAMEAAFGVRLQRWTYGGGTYRGRTGPVQLPSSLDGIVLGVFGLDNRPQARTHFRHRVHPAASDLSYAPPTVASAYGFPSEANGRGETIAVLELGGGYATADLATFFRAQGLATPSVEAVSVDGATNAPTGTADGPDGEVELDLEVAGSCAPGAALVAYFAPNTDQGFLDGLSTAIHDSVRRPSIVSVSWGGPESTWTAQARQALDSVCAEAAALGVSVVVAAGDGGASDGGSAGTLEVDFPASSPNVLACGGTRLVLAGVTIGAETVWNDLSIGEGATGGGVSQAFPRPAYQAGSKVPVPAAGFLGRGVPDVAGDADPATGYVVEVDGARTVIGGTSAVAPLWAALLARLNQALGQPIGFANPLLYAPAASATFHDIVEGSNGGYSAGPGWDACTGLGSPDGATLLAVLRAPVPPN